eukprot:357353-Chlamydomonas_euryale.AAC.1
MVLWPETGAAAAECALDRQAWRNAITHPAPLEFKSPGQLDVRHGLAQVASVVQLILGCDRRFASYRVRKSQSNSDSHSVCRGGNKPHHPSGEEKFYQRQFNTQNVRWRP